MRVCVSLIIVLLSLYAKCSPSPENDVHFHIDFDYRLYNRVLMPFIINLDHFTGVGSLNLIKSHKVKNSQFFVKRPTLAFQWSVKQKRKGQQP